MDSSLEKFQAERQRLTDLALEHGTQTTKRFFNLDTAAYRDGALSKRTKELLGLVGSVVLRCDDCINYHLVNCVEAGYSKEELVEAMDVSLIVGGSITIPHVRRAFGKLDELGQL